MSFDNAYEAITEQNDARWAFGTNFSDPLSGVDSSVPDGVDAGDLAQYCMMLGDDALIASHRLQEWCTNAPEIEEEVALANIALDLLGQARMLLARAGQAEGAGRGEDDLAYFRDEREFRNVRLVEPMAADFAHSTARLFAFATWRLALMQRLAGSLDPVLSAIAAKAVKEATYHRDYAAQWIVRLGDGTDYSRRRMQAGLEAVWPLVDELFTPHEVEQRMVRAGVGTHPPSLQEEFDQVTETVLATATLEKPQVHPTAGVSGLLGRHGVHTEAMGFLLAEFQSLARAHPEGTW